MRDVAEKNKARLDELPDNAAGKMQELENYEFLNPEAQKRYIELLNQLRRAMTQTFFNDIENMVNNMSQGDIERMKDMLKDLNDLLSKKAQGVDPDAMESFFKDFMDKYGDMFGDNPPQSLDELLEQMSQQMAAAQSLMDSLTPDQRAQLQSLLSDRFGDPELQNELQRLAQAMSAHAPRSSRYRFGGREDIDLEAAMRLMREMRQLDELINQVQVAERTNDLERIDRDLLKELLDDDAAESLDDLKKLLDALEKAGYIRPNGDKWELTPRGSRMIGQKALGEIYARLRRQSLGNHALPEEGRFGERLEQTKAYEFGDPFHLHMPRTIRNAIDREGPQTPVRLKHEDFEIYRSELITSTATAMLVDLSWSMALRGSFQAAKKVALALHNLITSRFPKDSFHVIGFAAYAKELKAHDLPFLQWDEYVLGTNMQHALLLAERLLDKHNAGTKQIIMISDGEPTAHLENGRARFAYPPTAETYRATLACGKALHAEVHRHQHLHARCRLPLEGVHGRHRPHQRRAGVLHVPGQARRVHPRRLRAAQAEEAGPIDVGSGFEVSQRSRRGDPNAWGRARGRPGSVSARERWISIGTPQGRPLRGIPNMIDSTFRTRLKSGEPLLGAFVNIESPTAVESVWPSAGMDFLMIDSEHAPIGPAGCGRDDPGRRGAPYSRSSRESRREHPAGDGQVPGCRRDRHDDADGQFGGGGTAGSGLREVPARWASAALPVYASTTSSPSPGYVAAANDATVVVVQIETRAGIDRADEIVATQGVDVVFLGPSDLSVALGVPGQPKHPSVLDTIASLTEKIVAAGKAAGTVARSPEECAHWREHGIQVFLHSAGALLLGAVQGFVDASRAWEVTRG